MLCDLPGNADASHLLRSQGMPCRAQAVECLAAIAESNTAHVRVLAQDGAVDSLLSVLGHTTLSRGVRSAAVLLQFLAQRQSSVRCDPSMNTLHSHPS